MSKKEGILSKKKAKEMERLSTALLEDQLARDLEDARQHIAFLKRDLAMCLRNHNVTSEILRSALVSLENRREVDAQFYDGSAE